MPSAFQAIAPKGKSLVSTRALPISAAMDDASEPTCWLCERPLGRKVEWHHPIPKSRGGRETVPVHPICHRTLHATFANVELARKGSDAAVLRAEAEIAKFVRWIADKPPDFHARTAKRRR